MAPLFLYAKGYSRTSPSMDAQEFVVQVEVVRASWKSFGLSANG